MAVSSATRQLDDCASPVSAAIGVMAEFQHIVTTVAKDTGQSNRYRRPNAVTVLVGDTSVGEGGNWSRLPRTQVPAPIFLAGSPMYPP